MWREVSREIGAAVLRAVVHELGAASYQPGKGYCPEIDCEEAVECLVIVAPTQVDSCHEIDLDWLTDATAGARSVSDIFDNGRLEGCGLASLVPRKPEKLHGLLGNGGAA